MQLYKQKIMVSSRSKKRVYIFETSIFFSTLFFPKSFQPFTQNLNTTSPNDLFRD